MFATYTQSCPASRSSLIPCFFKSSSISSFLIGSRGFCLPVPESSLTVILDTAHCAIFSLKCQPYTDRYSLMPDGRSSYISSLCPIIVCFY